jgi:hypothetical protein
MTFRPCLYCTGQALISNSKVTVRRAVAADLCPATASQSQTDERPLTVAVETNRARADSVQAVGR